VALIASFVRGLFLRSFDVKVCLPLGTSYKGYVGNRDALNAGYGGKGVFEAMVQGDVLRRGD
jgi:hypothetical protein